MIKSSFRLGSILPNFALWEQGGAQARRAAPLSGPAARPSLGAGRPGNESLDRAEDPSAGIQATNADRPPQLVVGCLYSRLNVASELARMGRRTSRAIRPGAPKLRSRPSYLRVHESLPAAGGHRPTLHRRNYLTSDRTSKGRLRRHHVMASPPLTRPLVSTGSPV
ncbi:MAG: hypothetical protein QOD10_3519 [Mycobacterium sp.]|jgi:hypothetical protein|nr:hypothetical protein [Mycobacterium sp.]